MAALAVITGLWAMGRWGMAWLVTEMTGQARSASDYQPFVMGPSTAAALAVALGLTAALNLWRGMAADPPSLSSSPR